MPVYLAFLRGINVGGNNKVPMADLREMLTALGYKKAKTLLQSGNAVFAAPKQDLLKLEKKLEGATKDKFGVQVDYMVRDATVLDRVIKENPFPQMAKEDPSHLLVTFLKDTPRQTAGADLQAAIKGNEVVRVMGDIAYITFPDGIGTSKVTSSVIDKNLGTRGTARNWNTILKLRDLAATIKG